MDKLPPEILIRIISYLVPDNGMGLPITSIAKPWKKHGSIAHLATVSKLWQHHVERQTFQELFLSTQRLKAAGRIVTSQRLEYVRLVDLEVVLDAYDEAAACRVENEADKASNNQCFTQSLDALFALLHKLDAPNSNNSHDRVLRLRAYSPSDPWRCPDWPRIRRTRMNGLTDNILNARFDQSYLDLLGPLKSRIDCFSTFCVPDPVEQDLKYRRISPSACCRIAAKLGKLDKIIWHLSDNEKKDVSLRKALRRDFAERLADLPQSLKRVVLHYTRTPPRNHKHSPTNILDTGDFAGDRLSTALRKLCKGLVTVDIKASLEHNFLVPRGSEHDSTDAAQWPNMQTLNLTLSAVTPSGNWLFDQHPDAIEDEEAWLEADNLMDDKPDAPAEEDWRLYEFRGAPNLTTIKPWFLAAAKAASDMPLLTELKIESGCGTTPKSYRPYCAVRYSAQAPLLEIASTPVLDADQELEEAWRNTALCQSPNRGALVIEYNEAKDRQDPGPVSVSAQLSTTRRPHFGGGLVQSDDTNKRDKY
ncbi:hypothetical protein PFICI_02317 [Pestalotiopsis fici W106-1]|uniref:F-box domain-containing protein n=1 Tax=Pestalotiopsis fici (strain W106-1 / CGMCC3.15140) TaxID=1229662 RepID=W3XFV7_PESFW|nr:uncharacterized protein PFICI_02317 [Pestalotiopsis fici W106-1]ETS84292.1 hypothetical protein PFICI_02317 [Pestalotiopsis fici W106-1]